jgi:integrase
LKNQQVIERQQRLLASARWVESGLVFTSAIGTPLDERNVRREFKAILERADLPTMRIHDLRHSTATILLTQGVHPRVVMEALGHSQVSLTLDTYSHVSPTLQAEAAKRMNDAINDIGCQNGKQSSAQSEESEIPEEKMVSRLGIEPRTRSKVSCGS